MPDTGKQAARAIVRAAQEDLSSQLPVADYPPPGEPWDGVSPGEWVPDETGLPPKCPIYPLGYNGEYIFLIDTKGQLRSIHPNNFGKGVIQSLLWDHQDYAAWAWPRSSDDKKKANVRPSEFNVDWARHSLYTACGKRRHWDPTQLVRGRGAWKGAEGELLYHCGDRLYVDGKPQLPGELGPHFYPAKQALPHPWHEPIPFEENPARKLLQALKTWSFTRPDVDPYLILGWIGSAMLAGALDARPTLVLVGDAGVGKTTMQKVMSEVMGDMLVPVVNATGAGIWQKVGNDSLAVAVDEFENDPRTGKGQQLLDLARQSVYGGVMLRGGADHKGMEFTARSSFLFGAVNVPPLSNADRSRMLIVDLRKLDPKKLAAAEPLGRIDHMGPKMLRVLMDGWHKFDRLRQAYGEALALGGHADRGQDVFATLLTCAHLLLGDEGVEEAGHDIENLNGWGELLARDRLQIVDDSNENWRDCLTTLMSANVDVWKQSSHSKTVGAVLQRLDESHGDDGDMTFELARSLLEQTGLGLKVDHRLTSKWVLCVPSKDDKVNKLFEGSSWHGQNATGVWDSALRQGPDDIICTERAHNRIRIDGRQQRCVLVRMDEFWQMENAEVRT